MNNLITINGATIRQYERELYCVNDLHKASDDEEKHKPFNWMRAKSTQTLINKLPKPRHEIVWVVRGGTTQGTFVCKELVFAYAMWVSPEFFIRVLAECPMIFSLRSSAEQEGL